MSEIETGEVPGGDSAPAGPGLGPRLGVGLRADVPRRERKRLSSVSSAIRLLKLFSADEEELGISELAKRLKVAKSTVHRLASALLEEGLLEQNPENSRYRLGVDLFRLGTLVRRRMDVAAEAKSLLTDLRAHTGENVRLAILDQASVVYVNDFEGPHPVRLRSSIGLSKPAFCTAEGLALLSGQTPAGLDVALAGELKPLTAKTATDRAVIRERVAEARRLGYAIDDEGSENGMRCIAAPVFDASGRVVAAIGVAGPRIRIRKRMFAAVAARVCETARAISARLGYSADPGLGA